jgi:hypothetical protein
MGGTVKDAGRIGCFDAVPCGDDIRVATARVLEKKSPVTRGDCFACSFHFTSFSVRTRLAMTYKGNIN